jgi:hypothetical protein
MCSYAERSEVHPYAVRPLDCLHAERPDIVPTLSGVTCGLVDITLRIISTLTRVATVTRPTVTVTGPESTFTSSFSAPGSWFNSTMCSNQYFFPIYFSDYCTKAYPAYNRTTSGLWAHHKLRITRGLIIDTDHEKKSWSWVFISDAVGTAEVNTDCQRCFRRQSGDSTDSGRVYRLHGQCRIDLLFSQ